MNLPKTGTSLTCSSVAGTQIAVDQLGFRWYKKGLNSIGDRIFHSWAIVGWYGRGYAPVGQNVIVITKEHNPDEHMKVKHKEIKKGKLYLLICSG